MEAYEKQLHINDETFDSMRSDADLVLQKLIKNMIEKGSLEGKLTINIDVLLTREYIPNHDPNIEGETRPVYIPKFAHKVGSVMQIKDETKGTKNYDGMELVWDNEKKEYILKPIANTEQMTIFDAEYTCVNDDEDDGRDEAEQPALEGRLVAALPGPATEEDAEEVEAEVYAEDVIAGQDGAAEDMSGEFEETMPFDGEYDDYSYEEPEEE